MRAPLLSILVLTACGAPAAPAPAAKTDPVAAPAEAPGPPAAKQPHGRVFLAATGTGLTPIACHEAHVPKFSNGEACLALMPVGSQVHLESGASAKVLGTGPSDCPGTPGQTLLVEAARESLRGHATAPADATFVEVVPPTTPDEAAAAAPSTLLTSLKQAVAAEFPALGDAKQLQLRQFAQVDLDGDGKPEGLAAVSLPGAGEDAAPAFAGLYLVPHSDPRPRKLKGDPAAGLQYTVLGALDLDADGKPELWLNSYDDDGFAWSIEQVASEGLQELGRWRCDA